MNIAEVNSREDLDRWVEHKLGEYDLLPSPDRKLAFLQGAKEALDRSQKLEWSENRHHIRNLVLAEIVRLRAEKHCHPTLF